MRVAFLTPEIEPSYGWARYAYDLGRALHDQGVEIVALTQSTARKSEGSDWLVDLRPVLPQMVPQQPGFLRRLFTALPAIRRAAADCDLLHVIAEPLAPAAALLAGKRPLVVTAHGTYLPQTVQRAWVGGFYRWAYRRARLIAVSDYTADQVRRALPGSAPVVIRNGVNAARFQQSAPVPDKLGPTILATGGVKARKGTHLLVEALPQVREHVANAQLVVTGSLEDGAYVARVRERVNALGVQDAVHLLGRIDEDALRGWYQHADVFALPALNVGDRFEGFGLVYLEASACGLPVVGTTGSGAAEAVRDGETGLLIPQDDVPALVGAIARVLTDQALRARMAAAGRAYAQSQDWTQIAGRVASLYTGIAR